MARYYIFRDGTMTGATATREEAVNMIHQYQALEDHPILRSEFSIIFGEEEFIPYPKQPKRKGRK